MLVPTTTVVALSVAVADREFTGEGLLVTVGIVGMGMVAESLLLDAIPWETDTGDDVGVAVLVALPDVGGVRVALTGTPEEVYDDGCSDAGTLSD